MEGMTLEEEWLASLVSERTQWHHKNAMKHFTEYMKGKTPEQLIEMKQTERTFETRVIMWYKWLQTEKKLSQNSAKSCVIGVQSFFSYAGLPLKLKNKLPKITMKLESYRPTVDDLQKIFRYGDLETKAWISLSRDCPARIGDLLELLEKNDIKEEMTIKSHKENVIGKVYFSPETMEMLSRAKDSLPKTQKGIDKLLERACKDAEIEHKINQHLLRKLWISTAINLGLNETIVKILSFKSVPEDMLTYFLDRNDLKTSWERVVHALPLENKANGRISNIETMVNQMAQALARVLTEQLKKDGVMLFKPNEELTPLEIIERYLTSIEKEKEEQMA